MACEVAFLAVVLTPTPTLSRLWEVLLGHLCYLHTFAYVKAKCLVIFPSAAQHTLTYNATALSSSTLPL